MRVIANTAIEYRKIIILEFYVMRFWKIGLKYLLKYQEKKINFIFVN